MPTIAEVLAVAVNFHQSGNFDEAQRIYREIIEVHPGQADAWHLSGLIALQQNALPNALEYILRAIEIDGNQPSFHNHLAQVYRALGRLSEAEASARRAIAIDDRSAQPYNTLGALLEDQGQIDQAIACYRRAVELQPNFAHAHCNLGATLHGQGLLNEAADCFRRAIQCNPNYAIAHDHLGMAPPGRPSPAARCAPAGPG